ncbi:MAG: non-homologous end-joining DNA ligase [Planctomycetota bacterium]
MTARLPAKLSPMLAKSSTPFDSSAHLFEIKWDGTRALAFIENRQLRLRNRRHAVLDDRYPEFEFLARLPSGTVLDGEVVVLRGGRPQFTRLLAREQTRSQRRIAALARAEPATYVVFDQLYERGRAIIDAPLIERRRVLAETVKRCESPRLLFSDGVIETGCEYFAAACKQELEGVMAKRLDSRYVPGKRSAAWLKIKRVQRLVAVIIGFLAQGESDLRSLLLATSEDGKLRYAGKVGSGLGAELRTELLEMLRSRPRPRCIIPVDARALRERPRWVEPELYCTVNYLERTAQGELRGPSFGELLRAEG